MNERIEAAIVEFLTRMPEWIRRDLASKDASARGRAEEALAAMIVNAIDRTDTPSDRAS